jgi:outer membrane protein TolC
MLKTNIASAIALKWITCGAMQFCCFLVAQTAAPAQKNSVPALTLNQVIRLAEANQPAFAAALAGVQTNALEQKNARASVLPSVTYRNQVIYTQPNGQSNRIGQTTNEPSPVFIANNAVREYASQGIFSETLGLQEVGAIRLADANAARANAELEIARRGLVATVMSLFYDVGAQYDKLQIATQAFAEANHFLKITQQRQQAREAAEADVIKAQIQQEQRQRDLADVKLAVETARLELSVLLFADPSTQYEIATPDVPPLPVRTVVETSAKANNPQIRSALASLQASQANTYAARASLLPELGINVTYGIDAPQFATNGPQNTNNLGYSGSVTLDIPVWNWLTSERKIKETRILQNAAKVAVTAAQRRLLANLTEFYDEAAIAQSQLTSLDQTVKEAKESLRLTNLRYKDGEGTVFEVVDAQNTLIASENAEIDGKTRYERALIQLQTLTGNL